MEHTLKPEQDVLCQGKLFRIVDINYEAGTATVMNTMGTIISNSPLDLFQSIASPEKALDQQALDAARWNAFVNCGRIRLFGWAGLDSDQKPIADNVHFGGEFWTHPHGEQRPEHRAELQRVLAAFADAQIALNKKLIPDESKPVSYYEDDKDDD